MLYKHLLQDLRRGSGQANRGKGLDDFTVLAILNCQLCPPDVTAPLRGWDEDCARLERDCPSAMASEQRATRSPASHLWMQDLTNLKISRQRKRCPAAGLASTHLASMKTLDQLERLAGSSTTDERQTLSILAQRSLAP